MGAEEFDGALGGAAVLAKGYQCILCHLHGGAEDFAVNVVDTFFEHVISLLPGDVILTGTPAGVGPVLTGQRVEVEIEGIGILSNPFIRRD